jgi:hypothetical protein
VHRVIRFKIVIRALLTARLLVVDLQVLSSSSQQVVCSRTPHQRGISQLLPTQIEPNIGTAGAGVLGETDATEGQKLE